MTPSAITLADRRTVALHLHTILTPEDDGSTKPRARGDVLQPAVPELAWVTAVYFWK